MFSTLARASGQVAGGLWLVAGGMAGILDCWRYVGRAD